MSGDGQYRMDAAAQVIVAAAVAMLGGEEGAAEGILYRAAPLFPDDADGPVLRFGGVTVRGAPDPVACTATVNRWMTMTEWGLWFDAFVAAAARRSVPAPDPVPHAASDAMTAAAEAMFASHAAEFLEGTEQWAEEPLWARAGWRSAVAAAVAEFPAEVLVNELLRRGHLVNVYLS